MSGDDGNNDYLKTQAMTPGMRPSNVDPNFKASPCLVLVVGPDKYIGRQWNLDKPTLTLGRVPVCDIHVEESSLSKAHAKFTSSNDKISITDLGATNMTLVNGKALSPHEPHPIQNNDQIATGTLIFKYLHKGIVAETVEKNRMQTELEKARGVQSSLLPATQETRYGSVQIGGRYRSATECGGDWWWHWTCGDRAYVLIGDATGHGASAALITSAARSAIATMEDDSSIGIDKVYSILSGAIQKCGGDTILMDAFIAEISPRSTNFRYVNASHPVPIRLSGSVEKLTWDNLEELKVQPSSPLGLKQRNLFIGESATIPGSRVVLFTDGLTERRKPSGELLSTREFNKLLLEAHCKYPLNQSEFLDYLLRRSDEIAQNAPQEDDITVVALDFLS